jgi:transposase
MDFDLAALPDDVDTLHQMISDMVSARNDERSEAQAEIDRLRNIIKTLQRLQFGRRSERLDNDQFQLGLEDLDADIARIEATRRLRGRGLHGHRAGVSAFLNIYNAKT